jgi:hypothetical protein
MPVSTEYFGVNKRSLTKQWSGRYRVLLLRSGLLAAAHFSRYVASFLGCGSR